MPRINYAKFIEVTMRMPSHESAEKILLAVLEIQAMGRTDQPRFDR